MATIAEHIEAAIFQTEEHKGSAAGEAWARDLALGVTKLQEARMWITRGLAQKQGIHLDADLEK